MRISLRRAFNRFGTNLKPQFRSVAYGANRLIRALWILILASVALSFAPPADPEVVVKQQSYLPFADAPIHYRTSKGLKDPVAKLQERLDRGEVKLEYEQGHGYLRSILRELAIPISSQTLVFSKTSFQYPYISPKSPRALYFNDDVYVGQVHQSKALEFVSFDPMQGAIFYILDEAKSDKPRFERSQSDCVQCHVNTTTRGIPGVLVRSVVTSPSGYQKAGTPAYTTGHESPLNQRWAGWYVTGGHGSQKHLGNVVAGSAPHDAAPASENLTSLVTFIDTTRYLTDSSDIVAHFVLAHQTQMHNLITLTNYQVRLALHEQEIRNRKEGTPEAPLSEAARRKFEKPAEELVRYLLFAGEAPLTEPVTGNTDFTRHFASLGLRDKQRRSLRDFDLTTRMFKYPCSYLIYSEAFDAIPSPAKEYVYRRLLEVLSGRDQSAAFSRLSSDDRRAAFGILMATKPNLPQEWKQFAEELK